MGLFFSLRNDHERRKKCKLLVSDSNVLMMMEDKEKMPRCCSACSIGKRCLKVGDEEEDVQLLVSPERDQDSVDGRDKGIEAFSLIAGRTRATRAQQNPVIQAPLRQAVGPEGMPVYVKVSFSTTDLMNWKESAGSYRENPEKMYRSFKMIIENHNPDWQDLQVLLNTLLAPEEKRLVLDKAREENERQNARDGPDCFMPAQEPDWDQNTGMGRLMTKQYQQLILYGVKHGVPRPQNIAKLYQVVQGKNEDPSAFYEQLCETARKWTDLDPEDEENKMTFTILFVGQSAPDIRRELQKVDGMSGMSRSQLIEIA